MIPRYLFRAHSPGSAGYNGPFGFSSQAVRCGFDDIRTLDDLEDKDARDMLQNHVLWGNKQNDILISFSSSFLFAVQLCLWKISEDRIRTTKENCFITILDTQCYEEGTFRWTVDLLRKYRLGETNDTRLRHSYHEGEYLADYELNFPTPEAVCQVPFSNLESSLYKIAPELGQPQYQRQLQNTLATYRGQWCWAPRPIADEDVFNARDLACNFGGRWFFPMTVWGVAMRRRKRDDVLKQIDKLLWGHDFPSSVTFSEHHATVPASLLELQEWNFIMETLSPYRGGQKMQG